MPEAVDHPILSGISSERWHSTGSLYYVNPVVEDAVVLMQGRIPGRTEPLTWVREGESRRMVYTGLGHPDDFDDPQFTTLLVNAIHWAMKKSG